MILIYKHDNIVDENTTVILALAEVFLKRYSSLVSNCCHRLQTSLFYGVEHIMSYTYSSTHIYLPNT